MKPSVKKISNDLEWLVSLPAFFQNPSTIKSPKLDFVNDALCLRIAEQLHEVLPERLSLGKYFEMLCESTLEASEQWQIVHRNQQIFNEKLTVGEFDLIIKDLVRNQFEHWEVTIKFYLQVENYFFGTNIRDRFDLKEAKLFNQQINLAEHPAALKWLEENNIVIGGRRVLSRGVLFYKFETNDDSAARLLDEKEKSYWLEESLFLNVFMGINTISWRVLAKLEWMSLEASSPEPWVDAQTLVIKLQEKQYGAVHIIGQREGEEVIRLMLVTKQWLSSAKKSLPSTD